MFGSKQAKQDRLGKLVETLGSTDHEVFRERQAVAERFYIDEVRANDGPAPR